MNKQWILNRIDELRTERNLTKNALNEDANFCTGMIYQWYNTSRYPSLPKLAEICSVMGVSLSQFFAESNEEQLTAKQAELVSLIKDFSNDELDLVITLVKNLIKLKNQ